MARGGQPGNQNAKGGPGNKYGNMAGERHELRARIQDEVLRRTTAWRRSELAQGVPPEVAQEVFEEYDPVAQLALIAVDRRVPLDTRKDAAKEVAQYLRPKLKSVEVIQDGRTHEIEEQKAELARELIGMLQKTAAGKRSEYEAARGNSGEKQEGASS